MTKPANLQSWSATRYAQNARFVADLAGDVLSLLDPQPGERVLDLGCGDGALTEKIAQSGASVVGMDVSPSMIAATRELGLDARPGDGESLSFDAEFNAVFSNAALHWMTDAAAVVAGIHRALVPGGRFVAEFGGHGNVAALLTALRAVAPRYGIDPASVASYYFPTAAAYGALLDEHGFRVEYLALVPRPTVLPTGVSGWVRTFRATLVEQVGSRADALLAEVEELLAPALRDETGAWVADYVRIRVSARKE